MSAGRPQTVTREASCSCGQLRATVTGEPRRVTICHCLACQRRTGAPFGVQARFPAAAVALNGRFSQYVRHADDDGEARTFRFCPDCGATVAYTWGTSQEEIGIPVGAFADPGFPTPTRAIYDDRRHRWVSLPQTIEAFD